MSEVSKGVICLIPYSKKIIDPDGCTHSIDNLLIEYVIRDYNPGRVCDDLCALFAAALPDWSKEKCTKFDCTPCSRYAWYRYHIWGGGFSVSYGHWQQFDKLDREMVEVPLLRVKFNPNKHGSSPVWSALRKFVEDRCEGGLICKVDYAVDVPTDPDHVTVHSRKEPGLHKGTRYFGQRNKHGRLKVYDKAAEVGLPSPVTRCEWTLCSGKPIVFDDVGWLTSGPAPLPDVSDLGKTAYVYARMLLEISTCGGDLTGMLDLLDHRMRAKIEPFTVGSGKRLVVCSSFLVQLLRSYCSDLSLSWVSPGVNLGEEVDVQLHPLDDLEDDALPF